MNKATIKKRARELVREALGFGAPGPVYAIGRATDKVLGNVLAMETTLTRKTCRGFAAASRKILEREGFRFFDRRLPGLLELRMDTLCDHRLRELRHTEDFPYVIELALAKDAPRSYTDYLELAGWHVHHVVRDHLLNEYGEEYRRGMALKIFHYQCRCIDSFQSQTKNDPSSFVHNFIQDEETEQLADFYTKRAVEVSKIAIDAGVAEVRELRWAERYYGKGKKLEEKYPQSSLADE